MTTMFATQPTTAERRSYPGSFFTLLVPAAKTGNKLMVAEMEGLPGFEPPRHVHTMEDEITLVKEGTITFFIGDDIIHAIPGDIVVLPKNVPHNFRITSEKFKALLIAAPGNLEGFFQELSLPHPIGNPIPAPMERSAEDIQKLVALAGKYGIHYA